MNTPFLTALLAKLLAITGLCAAMTGPAHADDLTQDEVLQVQFLEDVGASQRIDLSGKLRMLSQRVPAAACNLAAGIDPASSSAMLTSAAEEFEKIVTALEFGDETLGIIGAEERRKTLVGIRKLHEEWLPMFEAAKTILTDGGTNDQIAAMSAQSAEVLRIAQLLVSEISGQYADPTALLQIDALTIDLAGRQRMLAQRISKNVCLISSGVNVDAAATELTEAAATFSSTLDALVTGMPAAGIKAPPTAEIADAIAVVVDDWAELQPIVAKVLAGDALDEGTRADMFNKSNAMTGDMNTVVVMYSEASKLNI
ncbi:type IV pili methyl-accepting chemotaxis transducer N-terminal domain-containing protein [Yoonia sp. SS1-5]|uniref:Type IV pili methyl-accepting chemotaxis transducer N-terminal domain-containing protein n=1 Tax=Yoonia rhodophyticola TaxID=3137370 RepID=A0AAN0MA46_9RHOB